MHDYKHLISNHLGKCPLSEAVEKVTEDFLIRSEKVIQNPEEQKRMGIAFAAGIITCVGLFQDDDSVRTAIQNLEIKGVE